MGKEMMKTVKIVYWQEDDGLWLGYLQNYPDYLTQGES
jgi:predicted RNase H-like HicB family nuclease